VKALAVLSCATLSAVALTACDGEVTEPPSLADASPTPTNEATAAPTALSAKPTASDPQSFREFAALIGDALAQADAAFFADRGVETELTCTGDEQLGPCAEQPPGTVLRGIPGSAWKSDAFGLSPTDEYAALLDEWFASARPDVSDERGSGEVKLYALAQGHSGLGPQSLAIATLNRETGPATGIQRQARIFRFGFTDGKWLLYSETLAAVGFTAEDWLNGQCGQCYEEWEPWEDTP